MAAPRPVIARILHAVKQAQPCDLDSLETGLPELSWNQVFVEIDRLSRDGALIVTRDGRGQYMIQLAAHKKGVISPHARH
ncbi:MAG: hypothetical protein NTNFB02_07730 [Nitrospira sp.]